MQKLLSLFQKQFSTFLILLILIGWAPGRAYSHDRAQSPVQSPPPVSGSVGWMSHWVQGRLNQVGDGFNGMRNFVDHALNSMKGSITSTAQQGTTELIRKAALPLVDNFTRLFKWSVGALTVGGAFVVYFKYYLEHSHFAPDLIFEEGNQAPRVLAPFFRFFSGSPSAMTGPHELIFSPSTETQLKDFFGELHIVRQKGGLLPSLFLYGPAGTGKTALARYIVQQEQMRYKFLSGSSFLQFDETVALAKMTELFQWAKRRKVIIFLDEADAIFALGSFATSKKSKVLLSHFLSLTAERSTSYIFIAATRDADALSSAAVQRFTHRVQLCLPDQSLRESLLQHYIRELLVDDPLFCPIEFQDRFIDRPGYIEELAKNLGGFSSAEIRNLVERLRMAVPDDPGCFMNEAVFGEVVEQARLRHAQIQEAKEP